MEQAAPGGVVLCVPVCVERGCCAGVAGVNGWRMFCETCLLRKGRSAGRPKEDEIVAPLKLRAVRVLGHQNEREGVPAAARPRPYEPPLALTNAPHRLPPPSPSPLVAPALALTAALDPAPRSRHSVPHQPPHRTAMLAIHTPVNPLSTMSSYHNRPTHGRHPSAPVAAVRATQIPGLLALHKPANPAPSRQQQQTQPRAPRGSPKGKQRSQQKPLAQPADEAKQSAPKRTEADKPTTALAAPATQERSSRGRQPKAATQDQAGGRCGVVL